LALPSEVDRQPAFAGFYYLFAFKVQTGNPTTDPGRHPGIYTISSCKFRSIQTKNKKSPVNRSDIHRPSGIIFTDSSGNHPNPEPSNKGIKSRFSADFSRNSSVPG